MKTTLVGHACLLIESKSGATLLSDPCIFDIHFEEINFYYPPVKIARDKFPPLDVLYLSHRHQDHFDIRTLAYLPKDLKVLCPNDDIMLECLRELGYKDITPVESFESYQVKDFTLVPTPSLTQDYYPEHGLIIQDGEVSVWNQVDTIVSPKIIDYVNRICGGVDFAHVRFQPLLEQNYTFNKALELPFEEYSSFLKVVAALNPRFAVPGSAGERYTDRFEFLNHMVFPSNPEQFLLDMKEFCPEIPTSNFLPGDQAEITKEGVRIHENVSDLVQRAEIDPGKTAFNPQCAVPPISTLTEDEAQREQEWAAVVHFIEQDLIGRLEPLEVMQAWLHWRLGYRLEVFGNGSSRVWSIDFSKPPQVIQGYFGRVNLYEGISCSELFRLIQGKTNWDFVGASAQYRSFHNVYRVDPGNFEYFPQAKKFPGPLTEIFPSDREMDREKYLKDVRYWKDQFK